MPGRASAWEFVVTTRRPQTEVTLAWPSLQRELPAGLQALLIDEATGQGLLMNTRSGYTFRSAEEPGRERRFQVEVKPSLRGGVQVTNFVALPSRGGSQSFQATLTAEATVSLEVTTLSGRRVRALPAQTTRAGLTTVTWDLRDESGRRVPPGIYVVTLRAVDESGHLTQAARTVAVR
jgi:hypothetical protein